MANCVSKDFKKLENAELSFINSDNVSSFVSEYVFCRPRIFKMISSNKEKVPVNYKSIILQFIFFPITFIKLSLFIFTKNNKSLIFSTERFDKSLTCRYVNQVPSLKRKNYINLRYSTNHIPKIFDGIIDIAPIILTLKAFSRLMKLSKKKKLAINQISNAFILLDNLDVSLLLKKKFLEYILLRIFFITIIKAFKPKRVIFVSNNFFIPLIEYAKINKIHTYEICHAIMHHYHPQYSFTHFTEKPFFPDYLIENKLSFNFKNSHFPYKKILIAKDLINIEFKDVTKSESANTSNLNIDKYINGKKILIIGQGDYYDEGLISRTLSILDPSKNLITFRSHPSSQAKLKSRPIKISNKELEDDILENDIIISSFSQVIVLAHFYGKSIIAIDSYWHAAIKSMGIPYNSF